MYLLYGIADCMYARCEFNIGLYASCIFQRQRKCIHRFRNLERVYICGECSFHLRNCKNIGERRVEYDDHGVDDNRIGRDVYLFFLYSPVEEKIWKMMIED